jgi:hypothetical protein
MSVLRRNVASILAVVAMLPCFNQAFSQAAAGEQPAGLVMVAKIDGKLSTKNAKVGDAISAKILKSWKLTDGTDIPKGSKISGKVASIKSKKEGGGNSMLSFRLDEIDVKGSAPVPIHGVVVAIGPSLAPKDDLGAGSELGRNPSPQGGAGGMAPMPATRSPKSAGSSNGVDPNAGLGGPNVGDEDNIPLGSTMPGVSLDRHVDADGATTLQGVHVDIDLDSAVLIKVQLR